MPDPIKLDFTKAQPINPGGGSGLDFSQAQPLTTGPDDPNGNYDFGDLGKVQGMRLNGRPATRQEAFSQLAQQRGFAQTMGNTFQGKQQDVSNFISSNVDPDQATKGYMGDLVGMLAGQGLGNAGKLLQGARWSEGADAIAGLVRAYAPKPAQKLVGNLLGVGPSSLEQQTSPTVFRQFGQEYHMPVTGPPPGPRAGAPPILSPLDAAQQRESGTAAQLPFLKPQPQQNVELSAQTAAKRPPVQSPVSQEPTQSTPGDMTGYYGKTAGKSNLRANQRQLASPTAAASPNPSNQVSTAGPHPPNIMRILNTPGDISDADMQTVQSYFAQQRLTNMLKKAVGQ